MIDKNFLKNWLNILAYNKKSNESLEQMVGSEVVRIPLTPIKTDTRFLYNLFRYIYPEIINDQQNILDIIISNDEKKIVDLILYETNKPGVHESYRKLNSNLIKTRKFSIDNTEESLFYVQKKILKKEELRISHIRVFKVEFIDYLNNYLKNIKDLSFNDFLLSFLSLIEKSIRDRLLFIIPKPNVINFLEEFLQFFNEFHLSGFLHLFGNYLFGKNYLIVFYSKRFSFIVEVNNSNKSKKYNNEIKIYHPEDLGINFKDTDKNKILKSIHSKFKKSPIFLFKQEQILKVLNELFEFEIPLRKDKLRLFFQKILYQFRSFETNWFKYPRPKIYGTLRRFLIRLLGFNYNLKKLSHWAIPELFFKLDLFFGMNNRIIIIITDFRRNGKSEYDNNIGILLESENNSIVNCQRISREDLGKQFNKDQLEYLHNNLSEKYGYINAIIKIDNYLIDLVLNNYIFNFTKFNLFSKIKTFKEFKKDNYFLIYPEIPIYKYLKKSKPRGIIKTILPILIDKHEF